MSNFPKDAIQQAQSVLTNWGQISGALAFGELTLKSLTTDVDKVANTQAQISVLESQLMNLRNQRDAQLTGVWDKVKRVRAGVKSIYGDDSSEWEMIGGTRLSERKSPARRVQVTA